MTHNILVFSTLGLKNRRPLTCVWTATGDPRQPLACHWVARPQIALEHSSATVDPARAEQLYA